MTENVYIRNLRLVTDDTSNRVASFDVQYGPVTIKGASLIKQSNGGAFISMPSTKSEKNDRWYDHVEVDEMLKIDIKNKVKTLLTAAAGARQADPACDDQDIPY